MTPKPTPELDAAFPRHKWSWLRATVRVALEQRPDAVSVTLPAADLSDEEKATIRWLLKLPAAPEHDLRISLARLDKALVDRTDARMPTRALLAVLDGELADLPQQRRQASQAHDEVWIRAADHDAVAEEPILRKWLEDEQRRGAMRSDPALRRRLLHDALAVLKHLPITPRTALTVLSANVLGQAHALDPGPLSSLILRALALRGSQPLPTSREEERWLWTDFGVVPDELSSRVLTHGFRPAGTSPLAQILNIASAEGTPSVITLQQLDRHFLNQTDPLLPEGATVWMCENVAVIWTAAEKLGPGCPPILCVEGWPSAAAVRLITHLATAGVLMSHHGDFDKSGLEIVNYLIALGAKPWRMTAADFTDAAARLPHLPRLDNVLPENIWDDNLAQDMRMAAVQLEEEHLVIELINELRAHVIS